MSLNYSDNTSFNAPIAHKNNLTDNDNNNNSFNAFYSCGSANTNSIIKNNNLSTSSDIFEHNYMYTNDSQQQHLQQQWHLQTHQQQQRTRTEYAVTGLTTTSRDYQHGTWDNCSTLYNSRYRYMPYNYCLNNYWNILPSHDFASHSQQLSKVFPLSSPPTYNSCTSSWITPVSFVRQSKNSTTIQQQQIKQNQQQQQQQQQSQSTLSITKSLNSNNNNTTSASSITNNYSTGNFKYNCVIDSTTSSSQSVNKIFNACANTTTITSAIILSTTPSTTTISSSMTTTKNNHNAYDTNDTIALQITNLDHAMDTANLKNYLLNQLKSIAPVISLSIDGSSYAKLIVPNLHFAKKVVSNLHRKKMGHKRISVSYTKDSSLTEFQTLRCQVAGLLKDVPNYTLPMYKFRELFQSRFKTTISVLDLYKMPDICTIHVDNNEDKFISLHAQLMDNLETSTLVEGLQFSVPYCMIHFKKEQHKGWAEQEIEPLPSVFMTIKQIQEIIYPLMNSHAGDIPVSSLVHCIEGELNIKITPNENGVNLEHLICCVQGIQITLNNFGIKILSWVKNNGNNSTNYNNHNKKDCSKILATGVNDNNNNIINNSTSSNDSLYQISREIIELVKMLPKATMKFSRFIPTYHNHFGAQCRVADYGYTKLIELFEALSSVVQIMGDGENRQITLTHRTQVRRFTSDLLRALRANGNRSIRLSELPALFSQIQNRPFDITDYGVCDLTDILDGLANSNIIILTPTFNDIVLSMPKRKQTMNELMIISGFATEVVELFSTAPQYTISFQKFGCSYQYHFGVQCRLSDYGFTKLADLIDAIQGVVEMEVINEEDKKIYLSKKVARRVFAKQCEELILDVTGSSTTCIQLNELLSLHKKKFGYQIQPQTLGGLNIEQCMTLLPFVEVSKRGDNNGLWITCHNENKAFRQQCYKTCKYLLAHGATKSEEDITSSLTNTLFFLTLNDLIEGFNKSHYENLTETKLEAMKPLLEITIKNDCRYVGLSDFIKFIMSIVRLLEKNTSMILCEIKDSLNCTPTKPFEYGYPNLYSIITSYSDIFSVNITTTQEKALISLVKDTELRLNNGDNCKALFGTLKMPCTKEKNMHAIPTVPITEHNNNYGGSLQNQSTAINITQPNELDSATKSLNYQKIMDTTVISNNQYPHEIALTKHNNNTSYSNLNILSMQNSLNDSKNHSIYNNASNSSNDMITASLCSKNANNANLYLKNNKENKENTFNSFLSLNNSFNNSTQLLPSNSSIYNNNHNYNNSSNNYNHNSNNNNLNCSFDNVIMSSKQPYHTKIQQLNTILTTQSTITNHLTSSLYTNCNNNYTNSTKLWQRRQNTIYYQQQKALLNTSNSYPSNIELTNGFPIMPLSKDTNIAFSLPDVKAINVITTSSASDHQSSGYYELVHNMHMYSMYEPPKPDTPRSDNMPLWIDPIWTSHNNYDCISELNNNNKSLNLGLPVFPSMNVMPMVMSPYTLSKIENTKYFNFDSHDRKIV